MGGGKDKINEVYKFQDLTLHDFASRTFVGANFDFSILTNANFHKGNLKMASKQRNTCSAENLPEEYYLKWLTL
jgi:hypothetical protein